VAFNTHKKRGNFETLEKTQRENPNPKPIFQRSGTSLPFLSSSPSRHSLPWKRKPSSNSPSWLGHLPLPYWKKTLTQVADPFSDRNQRSHGNPPSVHWSSSQPKINQTTAPSLVLIFFSNRPQDKPSSLRPIASQPPCTQLLPLLPLTRNNLPFLSQRYSPLFLLQVTVVLTSSRKVKRGGSCSNRPVVWSFLWWRVGSRAASDGACGEDAPPLFLWPRSLPTLLSWLHCSWFYFGAVFCNFKFFNVIFVYFWIFIICSVDLKKKEKKKNIMKVNVFVFFLWIFFMIKLQGIKKNLIFWFIHGQELWTYM
jgi:hypothetical protein